MHGSGPHCHINPYGGFKSLPSSSMKKKVNCDYVLQIRKYITPKPKGLFGQSHKQSANP